LERKVQSSGIGERNLLRQARSGGRGRKRNLAVSEESDRLLDLAASYGGSGGGRRDKKIIPFSPRSSAAGPTAALGNKTNRSREAQDHWQPLIQLDLVSQAITMMFLYDD
jgi:hypothetical protein